MLIQKIQCDKCHEMLDKAYEMNVQNVDVWGNTYEVDLDVDDVRFKTFGNYHLCKKCVIENMSKFALETEMCGLPFTEVPNETEEVIELNDTEPKKEDQKEDRLSKEELEILLANETVAHLSERIDVPKNTIYGWIHKYGIKNYSECSRRSCAGRKRQPKA